MADEMPPSSDFTGLSRKVIEYSEAFQQVIGQVKAGGGADWTVFDPIVNTADYERVGTFLTAEAEVIGWDTYKQTITAYGGATDWEGTLRHITEQGNRVILELEERNTRGGETDVSNTVTVYEFDERQKLVHLDVYVMPLRKQPAA
jgi:hypothetical protein